MINNKNQKLYQKTEFNNHKICQLNNVFKCCKCKKNNTILSNLLVHHCLFCGTPNYTKKT